MTGFTHGCINLTKRFRQLKFLNVPFSKLLHRNCGQLIGSSFLINKLKFRQNPQKLFILAKTVAFMSCSVFVTRLMMLLLYFNILIISQLLSKTAKSSLQLQGHEGRSVHFVYVNLYFKFTLVVFSLQTRNFQTFGLIDVIFIQKCFIRN